MQDEKGFNPEYDDNKHNDVMYFSAAKKNEDGSSFRKVELLMDEGLSLLSEKNKEEASTPVEFSINEKYYIVSITGRTAKDTLLAYGNDIWEISTSTSYIKADWKRRLWFTRSYIAF